MKGEAFVKMPLALLESDAWRSLSINARRLIDFLMIEHMRHGGQQNGRLVAPRRQLCSFGINNGDRVTDAINEAEAAGLISVQRGNRRRPNTYALTWLPQGGTERAGLRDNPPSQVGDNPPSKAPLLRDKAPSIGPKSSRDNPPSLYRSSYQEADIGKKEEGRGSRAFLLNGAAGEPRPAAKLSLVSATGPGGNR